MVIQARPFCSRAWSIGTFPNKNMPASVKLTGIWWRSEECSRQAPKSSALCSRAQVRCCFIAVMKGFISALVSFGVSRPASSMSSGREAAWSISLASPAGRWPSGACRPGAGGIWRPRPSGGSGSSARLRARWRSQTGRKDWRPGCRPPAGLPLLPF